MDRKTIWPRVPASPGTHTGVSSRVRVPRLLSLTSDNVAWHRLQTGYSRDPDRVNPCVGDSRLSSRSVSGDFYPATELSAVRTVPEEACIRFGSYATAGCELSHPSILLHRSCLHPSLSFPGPQSLFCSPARNSSTYPVLAVRSRTTWTLLGSVLKPRDPTDTRHISGPIILLDSQGLSRAESPGNDGTTIVGARGSQHGDPCCTVLSTHTLHPFTSGTAPSRYATRKHGSGPIPHQPRGTNARRGVEENRPRSYDSEAPLVDILREPREKFRL